MKHKKILITGAGSFIGSHFAESLVRACHSVKPFVYYDSPKSCGWLGLSQIEIRDQIEVSPALFATQTSGIARSAFIMQINSAPQGSAHRWL